MSYPLAALLEVREVGRREAIVALAAAEQAEAQAGKLLEAAMDAHEKQRAALADERTRHEAAIATGQVTVADLQAGGRWQQTLQKRLDDATRVVADRRAQLAATREGTAAAREALTEAARALEALVRHREAWEEAQRAARERKAQEEQDEVAARRHGAK